MKIFVAEINGHYFILKMTNQQLIYSLESAIAEVAKWVASPDVEISMDEGKQFILEVSAERKRVLERSA